MTIKQKINTCKNNKGFYEKCKNGVIIFADDGRGGVSIEYTK